MESLASIRILRDPPAAMQTMREIRGIRSSLTMPSSEALNLGTIQRALDKHDSGPCPFPVVEIRMCAFEVERLGWEDFRGIPIVVDGDMQTGRFTLVCSPEGEDLPAEEVEVVKQIPAQPVSV